MKYLSFTSIMIDFAFSQILANQKKNKWKYY